MGKSYMNNHSTSNNYSSAESTNLVYHKRDKAQLKGEKESIERTLYKCPYCSKSYSNVTRYEVHLRTHTGEKPFACSYCSKKFNEKGNLKAHLRTHTGERPFKCTFSNCNMAFKTKGQLNDHKNRHSNFRPYKCEFCNASFNRKTRLKVHIMIHTGEKPFICNYPNCGKKFRERGNLNSHYKKHFKNFENKSLLTTTFSIDNNNNNFNENNNVNNNKKFDCIENNVNDVIDKIYGFDCFNNELFSLNELNLLCDDKYSVNNELINDS